MSVLLAIVSSIMTTMPEAGASATVDAERVDAPRLRIGCGYWGAGGAMGLAQGGALGASFHAGVQFSHEWAVFFIAEGATIIVTNLAALSIMLERTFFDHLSVGAGGGAVINGVACAFPGGADCRLRTGAVLGVNVPMRLAYGFGQTSATYARRHRFYLALDAGVGLSLAPTNRVAEPLSPGLYVGLGLGYTAM
jgi:hypothetical protein